MTVRMFISEGEVKSLHILSDAPSRQPQEWRHIYVDDNKIMSNVVDMENETTKQVLSNMREIIPYEVEQALKAIREVFINHE